MGTIEIAIPTLRRMYRDYQNWRWTLHQANVQGHQLIMSAKKETNFILCDSVKKRKGQIRSNSIFEHVSQLTAEQLNDIHYAAEKRNDIDIMLTLERFSIIPKKMMCHPSCRYSYINLSALWSSSKEDQKHHQRSLEAAHNSALDAVSSVIDQQVIRNHNIISLNVSKKIYVEALSCTDHKNEKYRNENLKSRLIKIYGKQVAFSAPVSKRRSRVVWFIALQWILTKQFAWHINMDPMMVYVIQH